jgi:hypothetical protein
MEAMAVCIAAKTAGDGANLIAPAHRERDRIRRGVRRVQTTACQGVHRADQIDHRAGGEARPVRDWVDKADRTSTLPNHYRVAT